MSFVQSVQRLLSRRSGSEQVSGTSRGSSDNRAVSRVPQRMRTGFVWSEKLITARPCMFKDLSIKGARVEVLGDPIKPAILVQGVQLYFDTEKHEIPCSIAWVRGRLLGLKFEGRPRPPSRKYG